jgi:NAD+ synthase
MNPVVGDLAGNADQILAAWRQAAETGADLVVTSELSLSGAPLDDFAAAPGLLKATHHAVLRLARDTASGPALLIGAPWQQTNGIGDAALLLDGGAVAGCVLRHAVDATGAFNETHLFAPAAFQEPLPWRTTRLGVMVGLDCHHPDVATNLSEKGAQILIVLCASPFQVGRQKQRVALARERILETGLPFVCVNQAGGQDDLIFDGASFVMDAEGALKARLEPWRAAVLTTAWDDTDGLLTPKPATLAASPDDEPAVYDALVTGLRDFVTKNKAERVLIPLTGDAASALVAALAVDALGTARVRAVEVPSVFTAKEKRAAAQTMAEALGLRLDTLPVATAVASVEQTLAEYFIGCPPDATEEKLPARLRAVLLMALAEKSGALLLSTVDKTGLAIGQASLYGDMAGHYAPLIDVYRSQITRLAADRNETLPDHAAGPRGKVFADVFLAPPLPVTLADARTIAVDKLDRILALLVEEEQSVAAIVQAGYDADEIRAVLHRFDAAEPLRYQAPPGPKVSARHLVRDRRVPLTRVSIDI